jgi:hypothetical protein
VSFLGPDFETLLFDEKRNVWYTFVLLICEISMRGIRRAFAVHCGSPGRGSIVRVNNEGFVQGVCA